MNYSSQVWNEQLGSDGLLVVFEIKVGLCTSESTTLAGERFRGA